MDQDCNGQFLLEPFALEEVYLKKMLHWIHIYHVNFNKLEKHNYMRCFARFGTTCTIEKT